VFAADDLAAWLIGVLADAGRKKLTSLVLGTDQERALRQATTSAVQRTADELRPDDDALAEHLALVISQVFSEPVPPPPAAQATLLETLQGGINRQMAVLDDATLTGTGQSSADMLGVAGMEVAQKLTGHLVQEIVARGSRGGPLAPLADQLNHLARPGSSQAVTAGEESARPGNRISGGTFFGPVVESRDIRVTLPPEMAGAARGQKVAGHVFISYVREDSDRVDHLQSTLQEAGIPVWRDTADLWPGEDWRAKIRRAITDEALVFIACFSEKGLARGRSYQNEELVLAIEQLRLRPPDDPWLIPVRFDECEIPDRDIGAGRTLNSIQRADLFGDHAGEGAARLIRAVLRILGRDTSGAPASAGTSPREGHSRAGADREAVANGSDGTGTGWPGPYVGETLGETRSVVDFDPLLAAARNRSTAVAITGGPSTGKTGLFLQLIRQLTLQGATVLVVDPNGETESLVDALKARGHGAQVIPLSSAAGVLVAGILDPFSLSDDLLSKRAIAFETLRLLLPQMSEERESAIIQGVDAVAGGPRPSLGKVVRYLQDSDDPAWKNLGAVLRSITEMPLARLVFAPSGGAQIDANEGITIFTGHGLVIPDATVKRDDYSYEQRLSVAIVCLATQKACRLLTAMPHQQPKAVFVDEAWAITSTPQGAKLVPEVSRAGRSRNSALVLMSSNASGLLSEQVASCITSVFAFRSSTQVETANVMALLGVEGSREQGVALRRLGDRECIYRDLEGEMGITKIALVPEEMQQG
jgi:AAA-like domain/TIR domain